MKVTKGQIIYSQGQKLDRIFIVKKGKVKLYIIDKNGKEVSIDIVGEKDVFGNFGIAEEFTEAFEDSEIIAVSEKDLEKMNRKTLTWILRKLSERYELCKRRLAQLSLLPLEDRIFPVAFYLAEKVGKIEDGKVVLNLSQEEFASFCGATRECVAKLFGKLKEEKLAETHRRKIVLYITEKVRSDDYFLMRR